MERNLKPLQLSSGVWEGLLTHPSDELPDLALSLGGVNVANVDLTPTDRENEWVVQASLPIDAISDGVQVFVIVDQADGLPLANFTLISGTAIGEDLRAEVQTLRAELEVLKRAFRRSALAQEPS